MRLILIFVVVLLSISCSKRDKIASGIDTYFPVFEKDWQLYLESSNGGWKNNINGRFSWDDAYALEGLIFHYERSRDNRYIDTFLKVATSIFNAKDEDLNIINVYRGSKVVKGWSTKRYTHDSSYHVYGVTNAMILYPFIKMIRIAIDNRHIKQASHLFLKDLERFAISEFEEIHVNDWVELSSQSGYFQDKYYASLGLITPVNQFARIGSYAIELYKLTGNEKYLNYAQKVAQYLKNNLIFAGDYFYWNYIINNNPTSTDIPDDIGHSILVVQFIVNCYKSNIVFTQSDVQSVVRLFKKQLYVPNTFLFREYLNGNMISKEPFISHFYLLSEFDSEVYQILNTWLSQQNYKIDPTSFLNHFGNKLILLNW